MRPDGPATLNLYTSWRAFSQLCDTSAPNSATAYMQDVRAFAQFMGLGPEEALFSLLRIGRRKAHLTAIAWVRTMREKYAAKTVYRRLQTLKAFVTQASKHGLVEWRLNDLAAHGLAEEAGPSRGTELDPIPGTSRIEYNRVIDELDRRASGSPSNDPQADEDRLRAIRDVAIIALLQSLVLRRSEVRSLDIGDVTLGRSPRLSFHDIRTGERHVIPLPVRLASFLRRWLDTRLPSPEGPLFTRFRRPRFGPEGGRLRLTLERLSGSAVYDICLERGVEIRKGSRLNPRLLRRTGISKIAELHGAGNLSLGEAMKMTRHKKPEQFLVYGGDGSRVRSALAMMENM